MLAKESEMKRKVKYTDEFLEYVDVTAVRKACDALTSAFVWSDSPQGGDAWTNVILALEEIRDIKEGYNETV
jgi:hypothetical protein